MNVLVCPDKFKGSLTAAEVADAIKVGLPVSFKKTLAPMADGGEGSLDVIASSLLGEWRSVKVNDPLFRPIIAKYYLTKEAAYIEMARASGFELLSDSERDCMKTSTYGTGELVQDAVNQEVKSIFLFIGGSATNDGGMGVANALGYQFLDNRGIELKPIGQNLTKADKVIIPENKVFDVKFTVVCDVTNPFHGMNGAAHVFAAQKGASEKEIIELDKGLRNLANIVKKNMGVNLQNIAGAGAAGGLGGGAVAFLNAEIISGTKKLIEVTRLEDKIKSSQLVITGEGKVDQQSTSGKLIAGICEIAKRNNVPVWLVCGLSEIANDYLTTLGVEKTITLVNSETSTSYAIKHARELIIKRLKATFETK